ncbi:CBS domain-containing protein [candidate division KSB3 bacterium]|uniref:CBS domain-containing protein n=1 Tax=candidate division KSB3 bacterium TaxID=2044937 RepID=A0A9D5JVH1_9BACT|nr:CBS domain-containing protein [candidate division KSB3 bacterium]MBD3324895.1 CBS domain-containing protein [candidate division KSB3 bacterium]
MKASTLQQERQQYIGKIQELIYELKIGSVMRKNVVSIAPDATINEVKDRLLQHHITGMPVIEGTNLVGFITIADVITCLEQKNQDCPVHTKMARPPFPSVYEDESVIHALNKLSQQDERRVLVFNHEDQFMGIITNGDITTGLLKAINLGFRQEEISQYRASHIFQDIESDETSLVMRYNVAARDFTQGGEASSKIKKAMQRLGAKPQDVRKSAIAIYEAEMNLIIHTARGGNITVEITPKKITMTVVDDGPGIPDIEKAMQEGYSTTSMTIKSLGFGAGMGLPNIKRCVNEMTLQSEVGEGPGKGTTLTLVIDLS